MDFIDEIRINYVIEEEVLANTFQKRRNDLLQAELKARSSNEIIARRFKVSAEQAIVFLNEYIEIMNSTDKSLSDLNVRHQDLRLKIKEFFGESICIPSEKKVDLYFGSDVYQFLESSTDSKALEPFETSHSKPSDTLTVETSLVKQCQQQTYQKPNCRSDKFSEDHYISAPDSINYVHRTDYDPS